MTDLTFSAAATGKRSLRSAFCFYLASISAGIACTPSFADSPLGWIDNTITSAYTLNAWSVEATGSLLAINSKLDFLNVRDDLISNNQRLSGDTGDMTGERANIRLGVGSMFTVFYTQQNQDMTVEINPPSSAVLSEIDDKLSSTQRELGVRWNFYEAARFDQGSPWHAASLEISRLRSETDDFAAKVQNLTLDGGITISFTPPQQFQLDQMEDETWRARLIYSWPFTNNLAASVWGGYSESEASSGTSSEIDSAFVREAFQQRFELDESHYLLGFSLNWQITPRLPLQLAYEFINTHKSDLVITRNANSNILPSFLQASNLGDADSNHTLSGSISYWITPRLHVGLNANLFSNQFIGVMPHFNNPLSGSFSDAPYGYAGLKIGYRI